MSKIIHELKNKRQKYLLTLYEKTEGNKFSIVNMWDVGGELGFTKEETRNIVGYLESERMLQHESLGGGISITHEGILRAEESLEVLGNDYWVNDPDSNRREASISIFAKLRDEIATYFNLGELRNLCFDLKIKYENLPGATLDDKCRELIEHCFRHGRFDDLMTRLKELRPNTSWETFEINSSETSNSPQLTPKHLVSFSFLRQWKPDNMPDGFGADILIKSDLNKEEIIAFIRFLTTDFITYADTEDAPILIRLWSSKTAYKQDQNKDFGDEFRQGFLVFYVKNLTGKGAYNGFNEIRWVQKIGEFSNLFGTVTQL